MKIAVISDIHSNVYALDEVLADIKTKNIDDLSLVITLAKQSEPQRSLICVHRGW